MRKITSKLRAGVRRIREKLGKVKQKIKNVAKRIASFIPKLKKVFMIILIALGIGLLIYFMPKLKITKRIRALRPKRREKEEEIVVTPEEEVGKVRITPTEKEKVVIPLEIRVGGSSK